MGGIRSRLPEPITQYLEEKILAKLKTIEYEYAIAGRCIAYYAAEQYQNAIKLWDDLIQLNTRYREVEWVLDKFSWSNAMKENAKKLLASL